MTVDQTRPHVDREAEQNVALIAASRAALPALIAVARAAERVDALLALDIQVFPKSELARDLRDALAALETP